MAKDFKDLLNKIQCGDLTPTNFTDDDLNKVKSCLPPIEKAKPDEIPQAPNFEDSCLPGALEEADKLVKESLKNVTDTNELSVVRGRLDELRFNLLIIQVFFAERLRYFTEVSSTINKLAAEQLIVVDELSKLNISLNRRAELIAKSAALSSQLGQKYKDLVENYEKIPLLGPTRPTYLASLQSLFSVISGKTRIRVADRTTITGFTIRMQELETATYPEGEVQKTVKVRNNRFLTNTNVLKSIGEFVVLSQASASENSTDVSSKLYDGAGGYFGLFRKLRAPVQNLYTLDERGLSTKVDEVDPLLSSKPDLPKTFKEDQKEYFIKSLVKYENFYKTLGETLPPRVARERDEVYPAAIQSDLEKIKAAARREAAHHLREGSILTNFLASLVIDGRIFNSSQNSVLDSTLKVYKQSIDLVTQRIADVQEEIKALDVKIKEASADPDDLEKKLLAIKCFGGPSASANAAGGNCEDKIKPKRGSDPLGIRTMLGTDASLPDMTTPCYWKYFAEELTLMGLLPIPDITAPLFRYYPVNGVIPAFPGPIVLTLPQKWKVLTVISAPIGTIVLMLSVPITFPSPVPIPLPSLFVFYLAPDGNKYMLLAPNLPALLAPNQAKLGFEFDTAANNPLGLSGPYSGLPVKGALTIPLKANGIAAKTVRVAKITADLANGKLPKVKMPNGKDAPGDPGELSAATAIASLLSGDEVSLFATETTPADDYDRLVKKIRMTINKQIDSFDDFATESVDNIKRKIKDSREKATNEARNDADYKKRRELKTKARKLDPINLEVKIKALIEESNKLIDNLTLGEITYPDDPSKLNPHLSAAITSVVDLLDMAARGDLKISMGEDLVKKVRRSIKKFDIKDLTDKESFNLEKDEELVDFKKVLGKFSLKAVDYFKGAKQQTDTSEARDKTEAQRMAEASDEMQDLLVKTLSFTAAAFAAPPQISIFNPGKPCCETKPQSLFNGVRPEVLAVLSIFSSLVAALINGLTKEDLKKMLGVETLTNIGVNEIKAIFDTLLRALPPIPLPKSFSPSALIGSLLAPILSAISLPELPIPGKPILPIQIKIPLDAIIKPLLKLALAALIQAILRLMADLINSIGKGKNGKGVNSTIDIDEFIKEIDCGGFGIVKIERIKSNQVEITLPNGVKLKLPLFPDLPLDILSFFAFMMTTDVIAFFKKLINAALDSVLGPISNIVRPILSLIPNGSWTSLTPLDLVNPIGAVIKLIKVAVLEALAKSLKVPLINLDVYPAFVAAALIALEALEKGAKEVLYIGSAVLCATGGPGVQAARILHPIFNQDDLPPWERLTRKNPLFAIFLDEILHRSTHMALGTLIFRTKLPGMYGVSTFPTIFVPPPRV